MANEPRVLPVKHPGANKVLVACNIPNGIVLRVCQEEEYDEPVLGGGTRKAKQYVETARFTVRGPAVPRNHDATFEYPLVDKNGFALTQVDAELWEAWVQGQKNRRGEDTHQALINGCLYAVSDSPDAVKGDSAHKGVMSGLQPLAFDGDPRMPRKRPNIQSGSGDRAA